MNASMPDAVRVDVLKGDEGVLAQAVFWGLQPLMLVAALLGWLMHPTSPALFAALILAVHVPIAVLEYAMPARPGWRQTAREKLLLVAIAVLALAVGGWVGQLYTQALAEPLTGLRQALHLDVWPRHWPLVVQLLMVFFASELIWYGLHRAEHRWALVWRASGHGAHHAFKRLNAINAGANHPLEFFLLALPVLLVDLLFGVGAPAYGAALLVLVQTGVVHSNLRLNARVIGWLLTTNAWHLRHHSAELAESNTNYGCAAIVWDRVFGTFSAGGMVHAGIGPLEPSTLEKLLMPLREPQGSVIAPTRFGK